MTDENLRKAMEQFIIHRRLNNCTCINCANLAVSRKTCNLYCLVEKDKTRQILATVPIPCDTFQEGHWSLTD